MHMSLDIPAAMADDHGLHVGSNAILNENFQLAVVAIHCNTGHICPRMGDQVVCEPSMKQKTAGNRCKSPVQIHKGKKHVIGFTPP